MKLTTADTKTTTTKTGTITVADIRKKFRIPAEAIVTLNGREAGDGMMSLPEDLRHNAEEIASLPDARLIVAAPELLAALKAMVASYDGLRDTLTSQVVLAKLVAADAAIAKAEGH